MQQYESPEVKSDEPSETEQIVCKNCDSGVTARSARDLAGNPTSTYRCPNCGPRLRTELSRKEAGA